MRYSNGNKEGNADGWKHKRPEEWETSDTRGWLVWAGIQLKLPYGQMSRTLAMRGKDLLRLKKADFLRHDACFGAKYYDLLHKGRGPSLTEDSMGGSFENNDDEVNGWKSKRIAKWERSDTRGWLVWAGIQLGQSYQRMSRTLVMRGKDLLRLKKADFLRHDSRLGVKYYDLLRKGRSSLLNAKSANGSKCVKKRSLGRYESRSQKSKLAKPKIWEFLRDLLHNPEHCPKIIRWEDYNEKTFRFVDSHKVAKLWGKLKGNENMNHEKLTRALRYWYKNDTLKNIDGRPRRVYAFGRMATGLETDDPNFTKTRTTS